MVWQCLPANLLLNSVAIWENLQVLRHEIGKFSAHIFNTTVLTFYQVIPDLHRDI